jgi:hypothetical protein
VTLPNGMPLSVVRMVKTAPLAGPTPIPAQS